MGGNSNLLSGTVEHSGNNNLTEESLLALMKTVRDPLYVNLNHLVVSAEGLDRMVRLCADDAEFRNRVLAEFPQLEGVL